VLVLQLARGCRRSWWWSEWWSDLNRYNHTGDEHAEGTSGRHPTKTSAPQSTLTATALPQPTATSVPGGPPYVGGPYSNFVAKYGQPFSRNSGGDDLYTDSAQTITIQIAPTSGTVTHLGLVGHDSWSDGDTHDYLGQFLPSDATLYNSAGQYTDYHSSAGDLVIGVFGQGTGVVNLVQ